MASRIRRWGNSLALRIPKPIADELQWEQDTEVRPKVVEGKLLIERVAEPSFTLETLLEGVTQENLHGEIDTSYPMGKEAW